MAIRIIGVPTNVRDPNRPGWEGVITPYQADRLTDLQKLPWPDGTNDGSSCIVLEDSSLHKLGTDPSVGVHGWSRLGK